MDRRGEALARDAFQLILRSAGMDGRWRRGREPPDYYLRVGRLSYAVEVTRVMATHDIGGLRLPTHGIRASLEKVRAAVQHEADRAGILHGSYYLSLAPVPSLRDLAPTIVERALRYIEDTASVATADRAVLTAAPLGRSIAIVKTGAGPSVVGAITVVAPPKRSNSIREDLVDIVSVRLRQKRALLSRVRLPWVLLLVDSYLFGEREHWRDAVSRLDLSGFHTVARIADAGVCHVLHSEERAWRSAA